MEGGAPVLVSLAILVLFAPADGHETVLKTTLSAVVGADGPTIRAEGFLATPAGHSFGELRLEVGTLKDGAFAPVKPKVEKILTIADFSRGEYSHTFAGKLAAGKYGVRATATGHRPGLFVILRWSKTATPTGEVE